MQTAIIYTRVSTEEQAEKGYSLRDQEQKLRRYCDQKDIEIIKHFQDDHSAKTFQRPEFNKLLEFIKNNKSLIKKLLIVKWDRFSRNMEASLTMITQLFNLGVSVEAIEQPLDDTIPENLLMKAFYLAAPQVENLRRSLNTTNGMRKAMKEGRWVSMAPVGYKNVRDVTNKPCIVHSDLAPLVKKAFELFATGTYKIEILRKEMYKNGLKVSRNQFCLLLRNPVYYGMIKIKAKNDEPEELVQGIHEPIISEELFFDVQSVLSGRKNLKIKHSRVNHNYPLRGYLQCARCGKPLTGSSALGNGGKYFYYHCTNGCPERHNNFDLHREFDNWISSISLKPEIGSLYISVMEDIFKAKEGDRDVEIKKLENEIAKGNELLDKAAIKLINDELDKFAYNRLKEKNTRDCAVLRSRIAELKQNESGFATYIKYGFSLLSNLSYYYSISTLENKQKMIGLIFPEKLVFSNNTFQTAQPNDLLTLLYSADKGFSVSKKEKSSGNAAPSYVVNRIGFEPMTCCLEGSCSIQLSYRSICYK